MSAKFVKRESYIYSHFSTELIHVGKWEDYGMLVLFSPNSDRKQTNMYMYSKSLLERRPSLYLYNNDYLGSTFYQVQDKEFKVCIQLVILFC